MALTTSSKMLKILKLILIYTTLCQGQINISEYQRMPSLYNYDNYYACINSGEDELKFYPAKYCMILVQIQPDSGSEIWQQIESMMSDKLYYRHDYIFKGLCMKKCTDLLENSESYYKNYKSELLTSEQTQIFQQVHNNTLDHLMRHHYQREIHECVNREYMKDYNLSTKTFVNFCIHPEQNKEKDLYFSLSLFFLVFFPVISIISTIYDAKLKSQKLKPDDKTDYYKEKHSDKVNRYLTAFSIYRNYKRLVMPNKSDIGIDLAFLDGIRSILCFLIVFEHIFLLQFFHINNTEFIENFWHQIIPRMLLSALIWLEIFFVLSGLLLYVKFEKSQYITPKSSLVDCFQVFVNLLFSRYLRYLPSLLFVIIYTTNIAYYQENNSLSRGLVDANCLACRNNWWQNILMINNYYIKSSCLMHTWYIAADFHLYGLFLIILIIMAKYPKLNIFILVGVAILAAGINFGVNYTLKLDPLFILQPESYRYFYFKNIDSAKHMYFSSYTNINSFLLGIVCGFIYMKYLRNNPENKKKLGEILHKTPLIGWLCILSILYLGAILMMYKETTIWTSAYGLLHRHVGIAIFVVIVILRSMCNGGGFLAQARFRFLARISFQVYLWQIVVLLTLLQYFNEPLYVNYIILNIFGVFVYVSTSLIAFVVALFVEYPTAEVINIFNIEKKIQSATSQK